jgi:uncharacterized protein YlxP (DUF503 family)
VHAAVLSVDIHISQSRSLKDKRSVVRHILDTARRRYSVAAAEVDFQDLRQRPALAFSAVGGDAAHVTDVLENVERFVWSHPEIEVSDVKWSWIDDQS